MNDHEMRYFTYIEPRNPPEDMEAIRITMSEKEIIDQYYPYWSEQMIKKYGIEEFETKWNVQDCIDDFVVIHWAVEEEV